MRRALDVLLPARCAGCGAAGAWPMCEPCASEVTVLGPPWCARCGRPLPEPARRCGDCVPAGIDRARAPFAYDGPLASAIRGMKFSGWHALADHLGSAMAEMLTPPPPPVATWVPLSRRRHARRGFDQAELLARAVARELGLDVAPTLRRRRATAAQARRPGRDRRRALSGAFEPVGPSPRSVLLVDDVLTTGATAASAAESLRGAGTEAVVLLTAARSIGGARPARG